WFFNFALYVLHSFFGALIVCFRSFACRVFLLSLGLFPNAAMRYHDAFIVSVEFDNHEWQCLIVFNYAAVFLAEVTRRSKRFQTILKLNKSTLLIFLRYVTFVHRADREHCFEGSPGIFFQLFMTQRQFAVFLVNAQDHHLDFITYFGEFAWV